MALGQDCGTLSASEHQYGGPKSPFLHRGGLGPYRHLLSVLTWVTSQKLGHLGKLARA